jgi:Arc/MetJ family transcription regulator
MAHVSINIDETACAKIMERYKLASKEEAINLALRKVAAERSPFIPPTAKRMTREEIDALQGIGWDGDLDAIRPAGPSDFS